MAVRIENITSEANQNHVVIFEGNEIQLNIRFLPVSEVWIISAEYKNVSVYGIKLSCNVLHVQSKNFPFDFVVRDLSNNGLDPYRIDDFSEDRVALYMLERDDMEQIRGQDVPI